MSKNRKNFKLFADITQIDSFENVMKQIVILDYDEWNCEDPQVVK